ncbi:MAG: hypothetical protein LBF78_11930 [Treponema sp.]|jgi:adenine-specific DNA-methyltransferase|nr:hypothetical protein [Treponema sp.]
MSGKFDQFIELLNSIFELDKADLDFGIYRIMNIRKTETREFLKNKLPKMVEETLVPYAGNRLAVKEKMKGIERQAASFNADPGQNEEYKALKKEYEQTTDLGGLETEVYSHLYNFFSRYYEEGDFISKRRYKEGVYAIPYEGEEIKLYWANQDQYYIKTAENFKDYAFRDGNKTVHFRIVDASTEQNNNKENGNSRREFMLWRPTKERPDLKTIEENTSHTELTIRFVYDIPAEKKKWPEENYKAVSREINSNFTGWFSLLTPLPSGDPKKPKTLLQKHLETYIAKNTFDYFIHKDLKGFLSRELDFYIKNEIIRLDDIDTENEKDIDRNFGKVRAVKQVGKIIIDFLSQIENFQKKLWLKKKFVVSCDWCVSLDKIPRAFYEEIRSNKAQMREWIDLYAVDEMTNNGKPEIKEKWTNPPSLAFLEANQNLVVDTGHFSREFTERLIASIDNLDEATNGILIHSENFQALNFLQNQYEGKIDCVYIDPPYNAKSSEILYKNSYKHSSWLTLMYNRLQLSKQLFASPFVNITAIDEVENFRLGLILSILFPDCEDSCVSIQHNPTGQQGDNISFTHDFAHFVFPKGKACIGLEDRNDPNREAKPDIRPLRNVSSGKNHFRNSAANCFYPIFVKDGKIIGFGDVCKDSFHPKGINEKYKGNIIAVYPIDPCGNESKWVFAKDTVESILDELKAEYDPGKKIWDIIRTKSKFRYKSLWDDKRYSANSWGSVILNNMFNNSPFDYPKSIYTVKDCIDAGLNNRTDGFILDYFAGSGTTGHAVINLNREDGGSRKYILVEMGEHFNTVTKPRIQKVIYAKDWKDGKPENRNAGVSQIVKYFRLESYEDTLANISLSDELHGRARDLQFDDYLVNYMLDTESSGSLLNLDRFNKPFEYKLKITEWNETKEKTIDLVETFNYLLGLTVKKFRTAPDFKSVEGTLPSGKKTLVIWRNITGKIARDEAGLEKYFSRLRKEIDFFALDEVYINGENTIANKKAAGEKFEVYMTESVFNQRMFGE